MRRMVVVVVVALACGACPPAPVCQEKVHLVDHEAWALVPLADDPWRDVAPPLFAKGQDAGPSDGEPPLVLCADEDVSAEPLGGEASLQLTTQFCSWLTVEQPSLADVRAGEPITARLWYFQQTSYPRATAEIALAIGDDAFFEEALAIPSQSGLFGGDYTAQVDAPAGAPIRWHVGNHGGNTWNLIELSVLREIECPAPSSTPTTAAAIAAAAPRKP